MRALLIFTLLMLLVASLVFMWVGWTAFDAPDMPVSLYIAMGLGVLFSVVIGCGLMALVFYSSRHGYDDRASGRDHLG